MNATELPQVEAHAVWITEGTRHVGTPPVDDVPVKADSPRHSGASGKYPEKPGADPVLLDGCPTRDIASARAKDPVQEIEANWNVVLGYD